MEKLREWGETSRKIVEEKFNLKNFVEKYKDIYKREIDKKS